MAMSVARLCTPSVALHQHAVGLARHGVVVETAQVLMGHKLV